MTAEHQHDIGAQDRGRTLSKSEWHMLLNLARILRRIVISIDCTRTPSLLRRDTVVAHLDQAPYHRSSEDTANKRQPNSTDTLGHPAKTKRTCLASGADTSEVRPRATLGRATLHRRLDVILAPACVSSAVFDYRSWTTHARTGTLTTFRNT